MSTDSKSKAPKKNMKSFKKYIWYGVGFFSLVLIVGGVFFVNHVISVMPSLEQLENPKARLASTVYSVDGEQIGEFFRENRIEVSIDSIPPMLINALIATEDRKYYDHWGVDLDRLIKAVFKNIFLFKREGASTITQQLAKNLYGYKGTRESLPEVFVRKLREWMTAVQIEKTYTKDEILEMYLNISWFGRGAYGIEMASKVYFGKSSKDLTIPEIATLIPLLKNPFGYDPVRHYNKSLYRRNLVMENMVDVGYLSREECDQYKEMPIKVEAEKIKSRFRSNKAPHFVEYVRQQMEKLADSYGFDLYEDGLTIYTSLDTRMQDIAAEAAVTHLAEFQEQFDRNWSWTTRDHREVLDELLDKAILQREDYRMLSNPLAKRELLSSLKKNVAFVDSVQLAEQTIEVGFVVLDVKTGEIRAMVGGRDQEFKYGLNHTTQIQRQPGSTFKPIVYTVALDNGLYPAYPILNQPFLFGEGALEWSPQNMDYSTGGFTPLRQALKKSINLISARLIIEGHVQLYQVGRYAERMGIKSRLDLVPSIALGTSLVSPLEMASAYATIANKGIHNEPISILKIEDQDGIVIAKFNSEASEAIHEETAYLMADMLKTVMDDGTGLRARTQYQFNRPAGGKTGTSQKFTDTWFVGFTPQLSGACWVGFDDQRVRFTGNYGQGSRAALPIWAKFMHDVYEELELPLEDFTLPESGNIVRVNFCEESIFELGDPKLYSDDCNSGIYSDIINLKDIPNTFNAERDTTIKIFERYLIPDSSAHEAIEITE
ncbi:MAG: PBP1A family penicillin-binding protein [Bacteroidetes bacterium]|nr:PBP1A family penicillin-binding protein [Bacteroidota bacterium]